MKKELKRKICLMIVAVLLALLLPQLEHLQMLIGEIPTGILKLADSIVLLWIFYTIVVKGNR